MSNDDFIKMCEEFSKELGEMDVEEREKTIRDILEWVKDMYMMLAEEYSKRGMLGVIKVGKKLRDEFNRNKHKILVCMIYAVKDEYRDLMSAIFTNMFTLL